MPDTTLWNGEPLGGKSIIIVQDGGLGDVIQFARYFQSVKDRGANVIVECHNKAAPLIATVPGVDKITILGNQRPDADVYAPLQSLPHILKTGEQTLAENVPYVSFEGSSAVNLPPVSGLQLRTGFCWSPDVVSGGAIERACPLEQFIKLLPIPGITGFSLQGGVRVDDLVAVASPALITDLSPQISNLSDLANAISQLDLVICVDSVTAHVAGALGKPTWVLLPFVSDWRWHPAGETSIWYPSMRLFRQSAPGDWSGVIEDVHQALYDKVTRKLD
jgi:hypothetical protein